MEYPDYCLRGIRNKDFLVPGEKAAASNLFFLGNGKLRSSGWREGSINWQDDENAIDFTMNIQSENGGDFAFKAGVAVLARERLDYVVRLGQAMGRFAYERQQLPENPYHGNLLLKDDTSKHIAIQIAGVLALGCEVIERP